MTWRMSRSASLLLRRLWSPSSTTAAPSTCSIVSPSMARRASVNPIFRCLAMLALPRDGAHTGQVRANAVLKIEWKAASAGVRGMSGSSSGDDDVGGKGNVPKTDFSEEDWNKVMRREKYVKRPAAIHDYDEPEHYTGRGVHSNEYSIADQEQLLTWLREYEAHPIGPWSWTPPEDIRPVEAVRQHGPSCNCELCREAPANFEKGAYLTKTEVIKDRGLAFAFPEEEQGTTFVFPNPSTVEEEERKKRNVWEEGLPSPPWLDDTYPPKYAKEIRRLYNREHPYLKGSSRPKPTVPSKSTPKEIAAGGAAEDSPLWLDSSYPPAYAKEIRRLHNKQKAEAPDSSKNNEYDNFNNAPFAPPATTEDVDPAATSESADPCPCELCEALPHIFKRPSTLGRNNNSNFKIKMSPVSFNQPGRQHRHRHTDANSGDNSNVNASHVANDSGCTLYWSSNMTLQEWDETLEVAFMKGERRPTFRPFALRASVDAGIGNNRNTHAKIDDENEGKRLPDNVDSQRVASAWLNDWNRRSDKGREREEMSVVSIHVPSQDVGSQWLHKWKQRTSRRKETKDGEEEPQHKYSGDSQKRLRESETEISLDQHAAAATGVFAPAQNERRIVHAIDAAKGAIDDVVNLAEDAADVGDNDAVKEYVDDAVIKEALEDAVKKAENAFDIGPNNAVEEVLDEAVKVAKNAVEVGPHNAIKEALDNAARVTENAFNVGANDRVKEAIDDTIKVARSVVVVGSNSAIGEAIDGAVKVAEVGLTKAIDGTVKVAENAFSIHTNDVVKEAVNGAIEVTKSVVDVGTKSAVKVAENVVGVDDMDAVTEAIDNAVKAAEVAVLADVLTEAKADAGKRAEDTANDNDPMTVNSPAWLNAYLSENVELRRRYRVKLAEGGAAVNRDKSIAATDANASSSPLSRLGDEPATVANDKRSRNQEDQYRRMVEAERRAMKSSHEQTAGLLGGGWTESAAMIMGPGSSIAQTSIFVKKTTQEDDEVKGIATPLGNEIKCDVEAESERGSTTTTATRCDARGKIASDETVSNVTKKTDATEGAGIEHIDDFVDESSHAKISGEVMESAAISAGETPPQFFGHVGMDAASSLGRTTEIRNETFSNVSQEGKLEGHRRKEEKDSSDDRGVDPHRITSSKRSAATTELLKGGVATTTVLVKGGGESGDGGGGGFGGPEGSGGSVSGDVSSGSGATTGASGGRTFSSSSWSDLIGFGLVGAIVFRLLMVPHKDIQEEEEKETKRKKKRKDPKRRQSGVVTDAEMRRYAEEKQEEVAGLSNFVTAKKQVEGTGKEKKKPESLEEHIVATTKQ